MTQPEAFDKNKRRKKIIISTTQIVIIGYAVTQAASLVAHILGLSSISYTAIAVQCSIVVGSNLIAMVVTMMKKMISTLYANVVFFLQFLIWIIMYPLWIFSLNEIRIAGLFFALMALIFLVSNSTFLQSLLICGIATVVQVVVTHVGITYWHQAGSFMHEMYYVGCFFPSALIIAFVARQFNRQRKEVKAAKRLAEKARDALWGEMALAKKIQTVLLPDRPNIIGYEISAIMKPADEVGGDYYDILNIGGKNWIAIGDVSGHGVPAGLLMMMAQTAIKVALEQHPDLHPSELLAVINGVLTENIRRLREDKYMTIMVLAAFDEGRFFFSGLHQDIMIYRAAEKKVELIETRGMWLGIVDNIKGMVHDDEVTLQVGDAMMIYTDGVIEAWSKEDSAARSAGTRTMFGQDHLVRLFGSLGDRHPDEIKSSIFKELENYECKDDVTILIFRRVR